MCLQRPQIHRSVTELRRLAGDDSAAIVMTTALILPAVMGFLALAVDVSVWSGNKTAAAGASDLAALSAMKAAAAGSTAAQSKNEALAVACANGFCNGQNGATVTVNNPPLSGAYTSNNSAYEVLIGSPQKLYFAGLIGAAPTVHGRAVALTSNPNPACILALHPSAQSAIGLSGSASITANGCAIVANSTNAKALSTSGGACVTANELDIVGNYSNGSGCVTAPTIKTSAAVTPDPYASLTIPAISACSQSISVNSSQTYSPGTYCGISVSGGGTLTLNAGTYYIDSGNLSVSGGSKIIATGGVTIVLTSSHSSYGSVSISGGSTVTMTAPSTGTMAGIALYVDRNATAKNNSISGGSAQAITGAVYMPTQNITYSGGANSGTLCSQLIAQTFTFSGNSYFGKDCPIPVPGLQTGAAGLVE